MDALLEALDRARRDERARAVILASAIPGRFCAGLEVPAFLRGTPADAHRVVGKIYARLSEARADDGGAAPPRAVRGQVAGAGAARQGGLPARRRRRLPGRGRGRRSPRLDGVRHRGLQGEPRGLRREAQACLEGSKRDLARRGGRRPSPRPRSTGGTGIGAPRRCCGWRAGASTTRAWSGSPRPRSTSPPRSKSRSAAAPRAAPPFAVEAAASTFLLRGVATGT